MTATPNPARQFVLDMIALLEPEGAWRQGADAGRRDDPSLVLRPKDPDAECFCLFGAAMRISGDGFCFNISHEERAMEAISAQIRSDSQISSLRIVEWNDIPGRTQAEVLDMLRRTADALEVAP